MIDLQPFAAGDFEPAGVEAQQVQHGGVDVGDVVRMLDGVEAQLVGRAVDDAPFDPRAGEPDGEAVRMVVAAGGRGVDMPPPSTAGVRPNSVQQTTSTSSRRPRRFRSFEQPGDRLIDALADCGRGSPCSFWCESHSP